MTARTDKENHRYCVIMCGGVGSRFWPFSRGRMPKQFLDFFGTGRTMLQMTFDRLLPFVTHDHIIVITNEMYAPLVAQQLPEIPAGDILGGPARRNTAPCVCWSAHHIYSLDPEATIVTLPSDHLILKEESFINALEECIGFADRSGGLLTLGITPTAPKTGYGYIQKGERVEGSDRIMKVKAFTEKPDAAMAELFVSSGEFFWNSGIFIWRADAILKAFAEYAPDIASIFDTGESLYATEGEQAFIEREFPNAPSISIDYAIMEKADNVYVMTVDLGWSDLGTWKALHEVSPKTRQGNVTQNSKVFAPDCEGSIFATTDDKLIVAYGLKDYIVAENGNTLLICPMSEEQKLRQTVNEVRDIYGEEYI